MADTAVSQEIADRLNAQVADQFGGGSTNASSGLVPLLEQQEISDESWYERPDMVARMLIDGATFGFSDEIAGAVGAGLKTVMGENNGRSYSETYADIVDDLEADRNAYEENNTAAAIGLNVIGGLLTAPVSITGSIARGLGLAGRGVARALPSVGKAATDVARFAPEAQQAISSVSPAIGNILKAGQNINPTVASVARFGTETAATGALAGAGYASRGEDVTDSALDGAMYSLLAGTALKGVGIAAKGATTRRVAQDLGEGGSFVPLNVADSDGSVGKIYRKVIGNLPVASTMLKQQTDNIANPLKQDIANVSSRILSREASATNKFLDAETNSLQNLYKNAEKAVLAGKTEEEAAKTALTLARKQANVTARTQKIDKIYSNAEAGFRREVSEASVPASARKAEAKNILDPKNTMQDVVRNLQDTWTSRGFEVVRGRSFRVSQDNLLKDIQETAGDELGDIAELYGVNKARVPEMISEFIGNNVSKGVISGEKLTSLRNTVSRTAYSLSQGGGESAVRGFAMSKVLSELDNVIERQLTGNNLAKFSADKQAYKTFMNLKSAVGKASTKVGQRGTFTPNDWLAALASNSRRELQQGTGVFQKQADELGDLQARANETIKKAKDITKNNMALGLKNQQAALTKQQKDLAVQMAVKKNNATAGLNKQKTGLTAQQQLVREGREASVDEMRSLQQLKDTLTSKQNQLRSLEQSLPDSNSASNLLSIGTALSLLTPAAAQIGGLAAFGALAGTQGFQRVVAGQTRSQQALAEGLKKASPALEALRKATQLGAVEAESAQTSLNEMLQVSRMGTPSAKAAMLRKLQATGRAEQLQRINPDAYRALQNTQSQ